ncbi:MAG: class IV adenylate cyclase [Anaerobutyricum soehngenii]
MTLTQEKRLLSSPIKGRKLDTVSTTRKELETRIDDAETTREILISLGYKRLYPVTKLRQYYHKGMMTACVDQVEGLGSFLELEILVNTLEKKKMPYKASRHFS